MKQIKILLLLLIPALSFAQTITVQKITKVKTERPLYYGAFLDDNKIVATQENYQGLYLVDLAKNETKKLTDEFGAGYKFINLQDDIYFRSYTLKDGRKFYSLKQLNLNSLTVTTLQGPQRRMNTPVGVNGSVLYDFQNNSKVNAITSNSIFVTNENSEINLHINGAVKKIAPFGKGVYVWPVLSPDKQLIAFTYGTKGTVISDLEGNVKFTIGKNAHFATWSPDGRYLLYMNDKDNGDYYVSSDIMIYDTVTGKSYQITSTTDSIEMYPRWSPDGKRIIFNNLEGELFIAEMNFGGQE